jgi:hypothetical protein
VQVGADPAQPLLVERRRPAGRPPQSVVQALELPNLAPQGSLLTGDDRAVSFASAFSPAPVSAPMVVLLLLPQG